MKIAIDCHTLEIEHWAGKEQYLLAILEELNRQDKHNDYVLYFRKKVFSDSQQFSGWHKRIINLPTPLWQIAVIIDLAFSKANWLIVPCTYLLPFLNFLIPSIVVVHDLTTFLPLTRTTHKLMTRAKERLLLAGALFNAKKIIAVSENTKRDLVKILKINSQKISVIGEAANRRFQLTENKEMLAEKLNRYNIPADFILFVGTLEPRKNITTLIEAFNDVIKNDLFVGLKLVVVGQKGWYYQAIFDKVQELKIESRVFFTGYLPDEDLPYLMNAAKCFVYPSIYEGFGLPPLEAMACGCPVITSNSSSLAEVVGQAAILVNPFNKEEISSAITKILSDSNFRNKLIRDGLDRSKLFSWEKVAQEYIKLY